MHGADERLQVVERLDGVGAADNEPLPEPQAGVGHAVEELLVNDPAVVRQDVPPRETRA